MSSPAKKEDVCLGKAEYSNTLLICYYTPIEQGGK